MRLIAITLTALSATIFSGVAKADDIPKRSPELQVLDRFVGTWDEKMMVKPAGQEAVTVDAVSFRRWSQGGSFVVFEDPGQEELNLPITYDPESKTYPGVMMIGVSRGVVTGTWDEDKKTMHFVIENDNKTVYRGTHRFVRKDYAEASGSITDSDGKVVLELSWKQTRRTNAQAQSVNEVDDAKGPKLRFVKSNGIRIRIAEMGEGPLVLLLHGWPESWYSWRHQMPALARAGFRVVAPDLRGYGKSDSPKGVEQYDIVKLTADAVGILDALGEETAVVVGHDWGAIVAWHCVLLHPKRFRALIAMSVPYGGRPNESFITTLKRRLGDNFFYILYFQEPGVAEAEFDKDPRAILSRLYLSPDSPREKPKVTDPKRSAGGWIPRLGVPKKLPDWLSAKDLDYFVQQFTEAGFRSGINYYRNLHRNWEITPKLAGAQVEQPVLFIAGQKDVVIRGATQQQLTALMGRATKDLRGVKLIPDTGHWVQQERPKETNAAMVAFLKALD